MLSLPTSYTLCCCLCCPSTERRSFAFAFCKVDGVTALPLPGARFILQANRRVVARAVSDSRGCVRFDGVRPGHYRLVETAPPPGYRLDFRQRSLVLREDGAAFIEGVAACRFRWGNTIAGGQFELSFFKLAGLAAGVFKKGMISMAIPLQGATFALLDSDGTPVLTATSDVNGLVALGAVSPGTYTLIEIDTPDGFIPGGPYTVEVSPEGHITVDGVPLDEFVAENLPFPNMNFGKIDPDGAPLSGGVFALDDLSGTIQYATSTADGTVTFYGLRPGQYLLSEVTPPFGFLPDPATYLVEVAPDGTITIGGADPSGFTVTNEPGPEVTFIKLDMTPQSLVPVLDPVRDGFLPVTGSGVPGSDIILTWPDTSTFTAIVEPDGRWLVVPPVALVVGQVVSAVQLTPNHLPSDAVTQPVQAASLVPPISPIFVGDAEVTGTGVPGSVITVLWPDGTSATTTVEPDTTWAIAPPEELTLGQVVQAYQTTSPLLPSGIDAVTVQQVSPPPGIDSVPEGAPVVNGTGEPGGVISIIWPGDVPGSAVVGAYGTWIAFPPTSLIAGQIISATQTLPGMLESTPATTVVHGPPA